MMEIITNEYCLKYFMLYNLIYLLYHLIKWSYQLIVIEYKHYKFKQKYHNTQLITGGDFDIDKFSRGVFANSGLGMWQQLDPSIIERFRNPIESTYIDYCTQYNRQERYFIIPQPQIVEETEINNLTFKQFI